MEQQITPPSKVNLGTNTTLAYTEKFTSPGNNGRVTYTGPMDRMFHAGATISCTGVNGNVWEFALAVDCVIRNGSRVVLSFSNATVGIKHGYT